MPLGWAMRDQHVDVVRHGAAPGVAAPLVLERKLLAAALGDLRRAVDLQLAVARERERHLAVLQVYDLAPVERAGVLAARRARVVRAAAALVQVAVVVPRDHQDVAVSVARARPLLLEQLEVVDRLLDAVEAAGVGEVACVDEEFAARGQARVFGVGVAYAGYWDGERGGRWFVRGAAQGEEEGVDGAEEGVDGVDEEEVEGGWWCEGRGWAGEEGHGSWCGVV